MTPAAMAALHGASFTLPRPWSAAEFSALLDSPYVFACTESAGLALGRAVAGEVEVLTLAVDPARRRQGTGRRLLHALLQEGAARGATRAFLEVLDDNAAAVFLYRQAGFTPCGRRRGYYQPQGKPALDALVMERPL